MYGKTPETAKGTATPPDRPTKSRPLTEESADRLIVALEDHGDLIRELIHEMRRQERLRRDQANVLGAA